MTPHADAAIEAALPHQIESSVEAVYIVARRGNNSTECATESPFSTT